LSQATEKRKSTLIKAIIKVAKSNPMSRDVIAFNQFIEGYFNNVALSDVTETSPDKLFYSVQAHWKLAIKREHRKALVVL